MSAENFVRRIVKDEISDQGLVSGAGNVARTIAEMYDTQSVSDAALGQRFLVPAVSLAAADTPVISASTTLPSADADAAAKVYPLCGSAKGNVIAELTEPEKAVLAKWCGGYNPDLRPFWRFQHFRLSNNADTANGSTAASTQGNYQPTPAAGLSPQFGINNAGWGNYVDFVHEGDVFFFQGQQIFSLWVNDKLVSVAPSTNITGTVGNTRFGASINGYVKVKFPGVARRHIRIGVIQVGGPSDLYVRQIHTAVPRFPERRLRVLWLSDSFGDTGASQQLLAASGQFAAAFGPELDFITGGVGGTGYLEPGTKENFLTRIASMDIALLTKAGAVAILAGQNDTAAGITTNAPGVFSGLRGKFPSAPIFVALSYSPGNYGTAQAKQNALIAAANSVPGVYVINTFGASTSGSSQWLDGTGTEGAPNGSGSSDLYLGGSTGTDQVHPGDRGHVMWGRNFAREVAALCKSGAVPY